MSVRTCFAKQEKSRIDPYLSLLCNAMMRGVDFFGQIPNELWVFILFGSSTLTAFDVLNLFRTCIYGVLMCEKFKKDPYMRIRWQALLPSIELLGRGMIDAFCFRVSRYVDEIADPIATLEVLTDIPDTTPKLYEACKRVVRFVRPSQVDNERESTVLFKLARRFKDFMFLKPLRGIANVLIPEFCELVGLCKSMRGFVFATRYAQDQIELLKPMAKHAVDGGWLDAIRAMWPRRQALMPFNIARIALINGYVDVLEFVAEKDGVIQADNFDRDVRKAISAMPLDKYLSILKFLDPETLQGRLFFGSEDFVFACGAGNFEVAEHLASTKCIADQSEAAFVCACQNGYLRIITMLVEFSDNASNPVPARIAFAKQNQAFRYAAQAGRVTVCKSLIAMGVNKNSHGGFAVRHAAAAGHLDMIKMLVTATRADGHIVPLRIDVKDYAAIRKAYENGHDEIGDYLCSVAKVNPAVYRF